MVLATAGAGTASLQWQFWNGTAWADLEAVDGFADTTNDLKRNGNVFWTADPATWSPSSVAGAPDLYFVRAYVASGSYTTNPVESRITTDILLFQNCADVTTNSRFIFTPPLPDRGEASILHGGSGRRLGAARVADGIGARQPGLPRVPRAVGRRPVDAARRRP